MNTMATDIDWIVKGAKVVTWTDSTGSRWEHDSVRETHILRVSAKSFTVADGQRFDLATQTARGATTYAPSKHCVPADSEAARTALAESALRLAERRADGAIDNWRRHRTPAHLAVAIAAMQELSHSLPAAVGSSDKTDRED